MAQIDEVLDKYAEYLEHDEYHHDCDMMDGHTNYDVDQAKQTLFTDISEIIEQSRTEWHIDGNVAIRKTGFITEQELRTKLKEYFGISNG